jgi:DNA mismatch endonuclease, patch repair protein
VTHSPWLGVKPAIRASMRANKSKGTSPEARLGALLTIAKYKFISHDSDLPGKPDFVFPRRRCVIFLHGCFWHQHKVCKRSHRPTSRTEYWEAKFARNKKNDRLARKALETAGWRVLVLWECKLREPETLLLQIRSFLGRCAEGAKESSILQLNDASSPMP